LRIVLGAALCPFFRRQKVKPRPSDRPELGTGPPPLLELALESWEGPLDPGGVLVDRLEPRPDDFVLPMVDEYLAFARQATSADIIEVAIALDRISLGATEDQRVIVTRRLVQAASEPYPTVRAVAVLALPSFSHGLDPKVQAAAADALVRAAGDGDPSVREGVPGALCKLFAYAGAAGTMEIAQPLAVLARDPLPGVRHSAAEALMGSVSRMSPENQGRMVPVLLELAEDAFGEIRAPAVKALLEVFQNCPEDLRKSAEKVLRRFHALPPEAPPR
jgi:HEAT repeat protein